MDDHVTFVGPARVSMIINGQAVAIGKIAAAEIERLRAEVAEKDKRIEALNANREAMISVLDEKDKRIEELESENRFHREGDKQDGLYMLTEADIDRAWELRCDPAGYPGSRMGIDAILGLFHIIACEECGGRGERIVPEYPGTGEYTVPCPSCDGHGWKVG